MATSQVGGLPLFSDTSATEVTESTGTGMVHVQSGLVTAVPGYGFPLVSGNYYDQSVSYDIGGWSGSAVTANRLYASLIFFPVDVTFATIGVRVTTGVGSALARVGLYSVLASGLPGALFWQGSTTLDVSTSSTNPTLTSQTCAVKGGTWYYVAFVSDSAVSTLAATSNMACHGYSSIDSTTKIADYWKANGSITLPDPFGSPGGSGVGTRRVSFLVP